jgi:hypothetical protein
VCTSRSSTVVRVRGGVGPAPCVGDVVGRDVAKVDSLRRSRVCLMMRLLLGDVMRAVDYLVSGFCQYVMAVLNFPVRCCPVLG